MSYIVTDSEVFVRDLLTDLLDTLALLLISAGLGVQAAGWTIAAVVDRRGLVTVAVGVGLFVAGMVVLGGSWFAARRGEVKT
jgi:hypothetical protein